MKSDNTLVVFKAISDFVTALTEIFGKRQKSLALYGRLIEKTTLSHDTAIRKHINAFTTFCKNNLEAIEQKNHAAISGGKITYSDRVYITLPPILKHADGETKDVIWAHLLNICALTVENSNAKDILVKDMEESKPQITDFVDMFASQMSGSDTSNPMGFVGQLMNSDLFQNVANSVDKSIKNGDIDMSKMFGVAQSMMGSMASGGSPADNPEGMAELGKMMEGMMGNLSSVLKTAGDTGAGAGAGAEAEEAGGEAEEVVDVGDDSEVVDVDVEVSAVEADNSISVENIITGEYVFRS